MAKIGIGLDIGTSSVKIVELEKSRDIKVNRFGIFPLPEGALNGGVVKDVSEVGKVIRDVYQTLKIKQRKGVVAIAGQSVIVRHLKMPKMSKEELANALHWEAERYIPFSIDEVNMDFDIIGEFEDSIEVMLVCAHNDIVYSHLRALDEAGVRPLSMDIQPFALMRAVGLENSKSETNVALLDIGAGTADLTIVKGGIPRFTRIVPVAGNNLTNNISNQLGISFDEAESAKIRYGDAFFNFEGSHDSMEVNVNYALQISLKELVMELRRSFDYYRLQQRNEEIRELVVSGGGSKLKNLIPFLEQELDISVKSSYADGVVCPDGLKRDFDESFSILTVAYGLALREVIES